MPSNAPCALSLAELEQCLRAVEPALRFIPPRVLRRVIKRDCQVPGIGLRVPHRKSYVIPRDRLLQLVEPGEFGINWDDELPSVVVLVAEPGQDSLHAPRDAVLLRYWRALFHARIHCLLDEKMSKAAARERLDLFDAAEVEEVRSVLREERYLLAEDDRSLYIELAAVYLELRYFNPTLLAVYFPGLDPRQVEAVLAKDLDAESLVAASRPPGSADLPKLIELKEAEEANAEELSTDASVSSAAEPSQFLALMGKADRAAGRGNLVRAAVLRAQAAAATTAAYAVRARSAAAADLNRLARRLQRALGLRSEDMRPLHRTLPALLEPAACGTWSVEARLLYDLQKVCVDHERAVYQVNLAGWLFSLGCQPLKHALPGQEEVLALKHLRSALRRLAAARVADGDRRRLASLIHLAIAREEDRLRDRFRPLIRDTLKEVGLEPQNLPEQVARDKLIEELLDRVIDNGYLNIGDLRDALSRNQLKLPDLRGLGEFLSGDPLIRANRRLADRLAGTYHHGEIYLRWLQRFSAAAFGTRPGRFLTLYLALPFGGAFVTLKGLEEVIELGLKCLPDYHGESHAPVHLLNGFSLAILSVFLFLLLHVGPFRRLVGQGLAAITAGFRWLFVDIPLGMARLPLVRAIVGSATYQRFWQFALKPFAIAAPPSLIFPFFGAGPETWAVGGTVLFLATVGLLNSRLGRDLEESAADWLVHRWEQLRLDIVPGLLRLILAVFRRAVEWVERVLYTVDEWLRFRAGDSRLSFFVKLFCGLGWFIVTYLVRVFINLFVEPTFNPIKHFPVVTVAAKLIVPFIKILATGITVALKPVLGMALAGLTAGIVIFFIPGLAGFLVWELKENWRLYRANRPRNLRPVLIGHHGETLPRLLRPGFHSGTLPKLYARLRKSLRRAQRTGRWASYFKQRVALHHVEDALRHFVQRELLNLLETSSCGNLAGACVRKVELSTNRVRIELIGPGPAAWLNLTESAGRLTAQLEDAGWLNEWPDPARQALAGLYRLGGVDTVRNGTETVVDPIAWEQWVKTWEQASPLTKTIIDRAGNESLAPSSP